MFRKIRKRCGHPMFWASIRLSWTRWRGKMYTSELPGNRLQMRDSLQGLTINKYSHKISDAGGTLEPVTWCHISQVRGPSLA